MVKRSFEAPVVKEFTPAGDQPDYESVKQWVAKNYESQDWYKTTKDIGAGIKRRKICAATKLSDHKKVTLLMEIQTDNKIIFKEKEEIG